MNIRIITEEDAIREAAGTAVIIDVFRAFSVSCYVMAKRPRRYIPVATVEEAFLLRNHLGNSVLIGERGGFKVEGFDLGNSPAEVLRADLEGKVCIHTTTAGTRGLFAAAGADNVITGSFVNAGAVICYLLRQRPAEINLYCTGYPDPGDEDLICAQYLRDRLEGIAVDFNGIRQRLKTGAGRRIIEGGFAPPEDFDYCMALDRFDFVLQSRPVHNESFTLQLTKIDALPPG